MLVFLVGGAEELVAEVEHGVPVLAFDAEHFADDGEGELGGDVSDEVALACGGYFIDD